MMRGFAIALACLAELAMLPRAAVAEHEGRRHPAHVQRKPPAPPPAPVCRPLCVADVTPCDPMEYKIADGRCSDPFFLY